MRLRAIGLYFFSLLFIVSCVKQDTDIPETDKGLIFSEFSFLRQHNPGLTTNVELDLQDFILAGSLPEGARVQELIASFELKESYQAYVNGKEQISGITKNDFSSPVIYQIMGPSGYNKEYRVEVEFTVHLPVIYINTEDLSPIVSKDYYINATVEIEGGQLFENVIDNIEIRGRGNSTWGIHPKKPYQIKFEQKTSVLGMPPDKRWLLLAEYSDKTFLRNRTAFELGYHSDLAWTPQGEYADVYLNGTYNGMYYVTQKVEESKNRVNVTNDGFLLEIDQLNRLDPDDVYFYSDHFLINIKEPDLLSHGPESSYIKNYVLEFEDALFSNNFKNPFLGYRNFIDVHSVVDWFLINEIVKNVDAKWFASIFFHKAPGEKLVMGPIWDFDLGCGNVNYANSEFPKGWWVKENPWIKRMCEDPYFVDLVKERYQHFRLKEILLYEMMDENVAYFYHSMEDNYERWPTLGTWVWPNSKVFSTYEQELDYLKSWLSQRFQWMDGAIPTL